MEPSIIPSSFRSKKQKILQQLDLPELEYNDLSPKGSIDEQIRGMIFAINNVVGLVTTSSCAGRCVVFVEGQRKQEVHAFTDSEEREGQMGTTMQYAGTGGKGGGGRWIYVSHDPMDRLLAGCSTKEVVFSKLFGLTQPPRDSDLLHSGTTRFAHFKFEPMILHILCASLGHAQVVLAAALQAGFRESGAINLEPKGKEEVTPIVAVRSQGLAFDSIIGYHEEEDDSRKVQSIVSEVYLRTLVGLINGRFRENSRRIENFRTLLFQDEEAWRPGPEKHRWRDDGEEWEDSTTRRERKRAEGLAKRQEIQRQKYSSEAAVESSVEDPDQQAERDVYGHIGDSLD